MRVTIVQELLQTDLMLIDMTILTQKQPAVETIEQPLNLETTLSQTETAPNFIDVMWVCELLLEAAREAQVHYLHEEGENYSEQDLVNCFVAWFDSCLDELATYAFDFCVKDSLNSFNRYAFQSALLRIKPVEPEEPNPDAIAY